LAKLDELKADSVGLPDFALHSMGARVSNHSPTFKRELTWSQAFLWRLFMDQPYVEPPSQIQRQKVSLEPGHCWPTVGQSGFVELHLHQPVFTTSFTLDHIGSNSPDRSSAPKDVKVYGVDADGHDHHLASYTYNLDGKVQQSFSVTNTVAFKTPFKVVRLNIDSNHGNPDYTCIYRFRVHGRPSRPSE